MAIILSVKESKMKRIIAIFFCVFLIGVAIFFGASSTQNNHKEYLRIHIRANSNSSLDQNVKYQIKDKVVEYLTPIISSCTTKQDFEDALQKNLIHIECIANEILAQNTFDYKSQALLKNEYFPARSYNEFTLESGYYDALIVNLGSGKGDNWWCVVYPPLCFINSSSNYVYKSRLVQIIKNFFGG